MRKMISLGLICLVVLWAGTAFAQYSALEDRTEQVSAGIGGLFLNGDNGAGESDSEFLPIINVAGATSDLAWQLLYGFGDESSVFGGSVDYILSSNFDECATCPDDAAWWFGAGATVLFAQDLFADAAVSTAALDDTLLGVNIGTGYSWDDWTLGGYVHFFPDSSILGLQGSVMYNFN